MQSLQNTLAGVFSSPALLPADSKGIRAQRDMQQAGRRKPPRRKGPRRLEIEAEHRANLSRGHAYAMQFARTDADRLAIDAEYERRMAAGPDFTHHRGKSRYGHAPLHGLDREARLRLRTRFNAMARQSWEQRREGKHRGLISRTGKDVFNALLWLAEKYDRLHPSLLCIARLAQCCKQSVVTALRVLEDLGFLTRHRRLKKVAGPLGLKTEQDTNGYELHEAQPGRGRFSWLLFMQPRRESKNRAATDTVILSYLAQHPETWGSPGSAPCAAHGEPPKAVHF